MMEEQMDSAMLFWPHHQGLFLNGIWEFFLAKYKVDIELHCRGHLIRAHQLILALFSTTLREWLLKSPCGTNDLSPCAVLNLDDVTKEGKDLDLVIEFIYRGKVKLCQSRLDSLETTAEKLGIQGLLDAIHNYKLLSKNVKCEPQEFQLSGTRFTVHCSRQLNGQETCSESTTDDIGPQGSVLWQRELSEDGGLNREEQCQYGIKGGWALEVKMEGQDELAEHCDRPCASTSEDDSRHSFENMDYLRPIVEVRAATSPLHSSSEVASDTEVGIGSHIAARENGENDQEREGMKPFKVQEDSKKDPHKTPQQGEPPAPRSSISLGQGRYVCTACKKVLRTYKSYEEHVRSHGNPETLHHCPHCDHCTPYKINLRMHLADVHRLDEDGNELTLQFNCPKCDFECSSSYRLRHHLAKLHTIGKRFECRQCDYTAIHMSALARHVRHRHSDERPFACSFCSYRSKSRCNLQNHERSHTGIKRFQCNTCGKMYTRAAKLRGHRLKKHATQE